jgi:hypothetical protein
MPGFYDPPVPTTPTIAPDYSINKHRGNQMKSNKKYTSGETRDPSHWQVESLLFFSLRTPQPRGRDLNTLNDSGGMFPTNQPNVKSQRAKWRHEETAKMKIIFSAHWNKVHGTNFYKNTYFGKRQSCGISCKLNESHV